nr:hypothetical protein GTC16762_08470 [Pigmentibacter ruber]
MYSKSINNYFISIIIPIYNDEEIIPRLVDEVLIHFNDINLFEIIFIDDKSTDNSVGMLNTLLRKNNFNNFKIILNSQNLGASATRNIGCKNAKGDYLAFLDSDDAWHKDKLNIQINLMQETNSYISGTKHKIISPNQLKKEMNIDFKTKEIHFTEVKWPNILFKSPFCTPSVIIHRSVIEKYLFNDKLRFAEDYDFWLRSSYEFKTIKILEDLTFTFKHDFLSDSNSLSSNLFLMQKSVTLVRINLIKDPKYSFILKILIVAALLFEYFKFLIRFLKKFSLRTRQLILNKNFK